MPIQVVTLQLCAIQLLLFIHNSSFLQPFYTQLHFAKIGEKSQRQLKNEGYPDFLFLFLS